MELGGYTRPGAGNHLLKEKVAVAAEAQFKGAMMLAKAADLNSAADPLRVPYDATVLNLHNVSELGI